MKYTAPPYLFDEWTPQQTLAVYDWCRMTCEILWQNHRDCLIDEMIKADRLRGFDRDFDVDGDQRNLDSNFYDDELPF